MKLNELQSVSENIRKIAIDDCIARISDLGQLATVDRAVAELKRLRNNEDDKLN